MIIDTASRHGSDRCAFIRCRQIPKGRGFALAASFFAAGWRLVPTCSAAAATAMESKYVACIDHKFHRQRQSMHAEKSFTPRQCNLYHPVGDVRGSMEIPKVIFKLKYQSNSNTRFVFYRFKPKIYLKK